MIEIKDKTDCCGCTACASICPQKCIEMKPDFEGFLYPEVNKSICINCGKCEKVCPILNKKEVNCFIPQSYVMRTKDPDTLMTSTSGGFITPLTKWVSNLGGFICGAVYNGDFDVVHDIVTGGVFIGCRVLNMCRAT